MNSFRSLKIEEYEFFFIYVVLYSRCEIFEIFLEYKKIVLLIWIVIDEGNRSS